LETLEFFVTVQGDEIIVKTLGYYAAYVNRPTNPTLFFATAQAPMTMNCASKAGMRP
jgi:hypothetical protein